MDKKVVRRVLQIEGMTCTSCEMRIENNLKKVEGIIDVKAMFASSNVYVTYDSNTINIEAIAYEIEKLDYVVKNKPVEQSKSNSRDNKDNSLVSKATDDKLSINQLIGMGIIALAIYIILKNTVDFNFIPQVTQNMGYGLLFVVGMLTSVHCIAMCGGINLSQCVSYKYDTNKNDKMSKLKPSMMYNAGRVVSYTVIGGIVGSIGSAITFSGMAKGIVAILSGVFMVIMGLNMLNIFPWLRKFNPRMPKIFGKKIHSSNGKHGPFYVGLLNGLMPCGPLQAMQLYALGTGSLLAGAASMFFFSLGTVPLMFGFGAISSLISGKLTRKMMKVSAVLVVVLGFIMLNRGLGLSGINTAYASPKSTATSGNVAKIEGDVQVITTQLDSGRYPTIVVQKGIPVRWNLKANAGDINGCNRTLIIPKYDLERKLKAGDNVIEFTPDTLGDIPYSCWMGMIRSKIKVVDDINSVNVSSNISTKTNVLSQSNPIDSDDSNDINGSSCCGQIPEQFADGNIPTDNIQLAKITGEQQELTVTVNSQGYSPAVLVLQKGVKAKIKFNSEELNYCNSIVVFPEYQGQLTLKEAGLTETPWITPEQDFTFRCGMGMLNGYVKVVNDINKVNLDEIKKEVQSYKPIAGAGGGCH